MIAEYPNTYHPERDPQISPAEMVEYFSLNPDGTLLPVGTYRHVEGGRTLLSFVTHTERPVGEEMPPYQVLVAPKKTVTAIAPLYDGSRMVAEFTGFKKNFFTPARIIMRRFTATPVEQGVWQIEAGAVEAMPEGGDYQVDINLAAVGMVKVISDENQHVDPQSKHEAAIGRMTPSQTEEFVEPGEIMFALEQFKSEQSKNT